MDVCADYVKEFSLGLVQFSVEFINTFPKSTLSSQYFTFIEIKPNIENATPPTTFDGWMVRVRVDSLTRGSNKSQLICSLGNLINFSLTLLVGDGQRSPLSSLTWPKAGGSGLLSKQPSRWKLCTSGVIKFPLHILQVEYHLAQS